jgi:hypothetical protein
MVKYCTFSRQSWSWSSCHVAVGCVADRIAPKCPTVYIITDTFTEMQTYCGGKICGAGWFKAYSTLLRTNTYIITYVTSSYKQEKKMVKINGSEGMLQKVLH